MACQHSHDDQTLRLQAGAGEDFIHLPGGHDRVACERQKEEDPRFPRLPFSRLSTNNDFKTGIRVAALPGVIGSVVGLASPVSGNFVTG